PTGVGAGGWLLVMAAPKNQDGPQGSIRLFNADGSEAEISGNGTRCAAAFLLDAGEVEGDEIRICTGAGVKHLRLIERSDLKYLFEMNMGRPEVKDEHVRHTLPLAGGPQEVTILYVGNPQCAVFVNDFGFDWKGMGAGIESHPYFPNRTNVSFVRPVDEHTIDVRFYERGVGETMSSGTGSTGAAAAAIMRGVARSPIRVLTPAGPLELRWEGDIYLTGPAEIIAGGEFYL
ncbi:MAG: diaminopimelate epimerase, partial [Acidobacteria bacterium]|nr:diaminopimelate epimerase [Acidobacteriota bacterium]